MGASLTAELLAAAGGLNRFTSGDHLAAAAGLAPALVQSGKVRYLQRPLTGDRALKRVFYQSAFCALPTDPASRTFYDRKRADGKRHHQALIALARRRINVLYAMLRDRQPYQTRQPKQLDKNISLRPYKSEAEALADCLRLARGMTFKAAAAGVNLGGAKV